MILLVFLILYKHSSRMFIMFKWNVHYVLWILYWMRFIKIKIKEKKVCVCVCVCVCVLIVVSMVMRWDTTSRRRGGSLLLNSINLVYSHLAMVVLMIFRWWRFTLQLNVEFIFYIFMLVYRIMFLWGIHACSTFEFNWSNLFLQIHQSLSFPIR